MKKGKLPSRGGLYDDRMIATADVARHRGPHIRLAKGALGVTVPAHGSIAPGTLQSILRQSAVSVEEFVEALR